MNGDLFFMAISPPFPNYPNR